MTIRIGDTAVEVRAIAEDQYVLASASAPPSSDDTEPSESLHWPPTPNASQPSAAATPGSLAATPGKAPPNAGNETTPVLDAPMPLLGAWAASKSQETARSDTDVAMAKWLEAEQYCRKAPTILDRWFCQSREW